MTAGGRNGAAHPATARTVDASKVYALDAPAKQLTVAATSGHRALWEQPGAFHIFMTETVLAQQTTG